MSKVPSDLMLTQTRAALSWTMLRITTVNIVNGYHHITHLGSDAEPELGEDSVAAPPETAEVEHGGGEPLPAPRHQAAHPPAAGGQSGGALPRCSLPRVPVQEGGGGYGVQVALHGAAQPVVHHLHHTSLGTRPVKTTSPPTCSCSELRRAVSSASPVSRPVARCSLVATARAAAELVAGRLATLLDLLRLAAWCSPPTLQQRSAQCPGQHSY